MITYPAHRIPFRIIGIDPGSSALGVAVLDLYLDDLTVELVDARTFNAAKGIRDYDVLVQYQHERFARLQYMSDSLSGYIYAMRPNGVASESPYMGRFPAAFRALSECLLIIHQAVVAYDPYTRLHMIDPMTVKAAVGVVSKGYKNKAALAKEHVRNAVLGLTLSNPNNIPMDQLDEHSIDAIAVAMARIRAMLAV